MLIDHVIIKVKAGDGGDGVVRWRREKGIPFGGPAGGDGGKGGDIYLKVIQDIQALDDYKNKKEWEGEKGENGKKRSMHGANSNDLFLRVPVGSIVFDKTYNRKYNCNKEGEEILILHGGEGGYGNEKFKTSINRAPEEFTKGKRGENAELQIELKLIANAGIIGLPSSGKSSLLNALTNATAKVGAYPFTTLEPNLGVFQKYVLADIPGLIEGASEGKGLGHKFLKHISRTKILFHLISAGEEDVKNNYKIIRNELKSFDKKNINNDLILEKDDLLFNKQEIVILSKIDEVKDKKELDKKINDLAKISKKEKEEILLLSLYDDKILKDFSKKIEKVLKNI